MLVGLARLFALPDLPLDHASADPKAHGIDGGALGEREDVDALEPLGRRIAELLGHRHARDGASDPHPDVGPDGRYLVGAAGDVRVDEEASVGDAGRAFLGPRARRPGDRQDGYQPADQSESHAAPP